MGLIDRIKKAFSSPLPKPFKTHYLNLKTYHDPLHAATRIFPAVHERYGENPEYQGKSLAVEEKPGHVYAVHFFHSSKEEQPFSLDLCRKGTLIMHDRIPHPNDPPEIYCMG
ncbi:hypothetical protein KW805_05045 [Candidatus Pacearchaeota archaeon]|nr:hypothetical protein [Candidatus Pacearchaeota archaeon]